jgi:hypothetical protein
LLIELARGAANLRTLHGHDYLDIEWAWDGRTAWFLQARALASV